MPARTSPLERSGRPQHKAAARAIKDPKRRLVKVIELLEANLGVPVWDGPKDALEVLVLTILSQNTTDPNALRGYENLARLHPNPHGERRDRSAIPRTSAGEVDKVQLRLSNAARAVGPPDWAEVAKLSHNALADAIRAAGLPDSKAGAISGVLKWLSGETGGYRLEAAIEKLGLDETLAQITSLKGIGAKTVAVTLIEALGADLCPVDTHVHRIINRLGIVDTHSNRDRTYELLRSMVPARRGYGLHHNLLTFGRTVCTAKKPSCGECVLAKLCPGAAR
ncbi:MAG: hypothetical protein OEY28_09055 [Nitrospira sp.]|nr:hypothetical protein [Nitrospira sp.]